MDDDVFGDAVAVVVDGEVAFVELDASVGAVAVCVGLPGVGCPGRKRAERGEVIQAGGEKRCVYWLDCPYRKPTQVDEEKILRPSGEGLLRN